MRARWIGVTAAALVLIQGSPASAQEEWSVSTGWGASEDLDILDTTSIQSFQVGLVGITDAGRVSATGGIPTQPFAFQATLEPRWAKEGVRGGPETHP